MLLPPQLLVLRMVVLRLFMLLHLQLQLIYLMLLEVRFWFFWLMYLLHWWIHSTYMNIFPAVALHNFVSYAFIIIVIIEKRRHRCTKICCFMLLWFFVLFLLLIMLKWVRYQFRWWIIVVLSRYQYINHIIFWSDGCCRKPNCDASDWYTCDELLK